MKIIHKFKKNFFNNWNIYRISSQMAGKGEYPPTSATLPFSASLNPPSHPLL